MTRRFVFMRSALAFLSPILWACGGGDGPTGGTKPRVPTAVAAVNGAPQNGTVATAVGTPPSVRVTDAQGPIAGVSVKFTVTSGGGSASPPTKTTDANGIATTTWTLGTTAGPQALTAEVTGLPLVTFTADAAPGSPDAVTPVGGNSQTATAGKPVPIPLQVKVTDAFGNARAGETVTFTIQAGGGVLTGAVQVTDAAGVAALGSWTLGPIPGVQRVVASAGAATPAQFQATALAVPPAQVLLIAGNNQSANTGTTVPILPTIEARDSMGNLQQYVTVTFTASSGGGSVLGGTQITGVNGRASVTGWILGSTPGPNTLTATVDGNPPTVFNANGTLGVPASVVIAAGDAQTAARGNFLPVAPRARVVDAGGAAVAGVTVTFSPAAGSGSVIGAAAVTDFTGHAQPQAWRLGDAVGPQSLTATFTAAPTAQFAAAVGQATTFTATATDAPARDFKIEVRYTGTPPNAAQQAAFDAAVEKWSSLIVGDLPEIPLLLGASENGCYPALDETVDDLVIFAQLVPIDGVGNVLGAAGPCLIRTDGGLPIVGLMRFDTADLTTLENDGTLAPVILHEMGHVLGIGTIWTRLNLAVGLGGSDPNFTGPNGVLGMIASLFPGAIAPSTGVPIENGGGAGTRDSHWREETFTNELMTGFLDPQNPLSLITSLSLRDMGYQVDDFHTDPYQFGAPALRGVPFLAREIKEAPVEGLIGVVDRRGRITRLVPRN